MDAFNPGGYIPRPLGPSLQFRAGTDCPAALARSATALFDASQGWRLPEDRFDDIGRFVAIAGDRRSGDPDAAFRRCQGTRGLPDVAEIPVAKPKYCVSIAAGALLASGATHQGAEIVSVLDEDWAKFAIEL